jgi:hypothetical protein
MTCSFPSLGIQCVKKKGKKSEFMHRVSNNFSSCKVLKENK